MFTRPLPRSARNGASALALATALLAGPAPAQLSFNAPDPSIPSGSVNFVRGSGGVETYFINSPTAVIDFTPSDTGTGGPPINFQNAGTSVTYQGTSDFTVLNRIVPADPSRAIQFNGTVNSRVGAGAPIVGGSVWFYSPGGIILGAGASFDVGGLLLATGDPTGGSGSIASTNSFSIASAANSNAAVEIRAGATIKATPEGSYVALVAPVVRQDGSVRVNGSAAYVAAEQASLIISQGLFDIDVVVGSDGGGTPLIHGGTSGGPSGNGGGDNHGIYMVAVPKNTAITMLIAPNGDLGFDAAAAATIENGAIYLQAGGDVEVNAGNPVESRINLLPDSPLAATISLAGGNSGGTAITSTLVAQATGDTTVQSTANNLLTGIDGDAYLYAGKTASLTNSSGTGFTASGRVVVHALGFAAGQANVLAEAGSSMTFQDALDIYASPYDGRSYPSVFNTEQGGTAFLQANGAGATISVAGPVRVFAEGIDVAEIKNTVGGSARLFASNGGDITLAQGATLDASARIAAPALTATGGSAIFEVDDGTIDVVGATVIDASALGLSGGSAIGGSARFVTNVQGGSITGESVKIDASGTAFSSASGPGGSGTGGTAAFDLSTTSKSSTVTLDSVTQLANGLGGFSSGAGASGGAGAGGLVRTLVFKGTSADIAAGFTATARGVGGGSGSGADGADGTAGSAQFQVSGALTFQTATIQAGGEGGLGGTGPTPTAPGGDGGSALANPSGIIFQVLNGGTLTATSATLATTALGGAGGNGAGGTGVAGSGGDAAASGIFVNTAASGGQLKLSTGLSADTRAVGGLTGSGDGGAATKGGAAIGGNITVIADAGLIEIGDLDALADGFGGSGFGAGIDGGDGKGGAAVFVAAAGGTLRVTSGDAFATASGVGGRNSGGGDKTGGSGIGGRVDWNADGGVIELVGTGLSADAGGIGGDYTGANGGIGGAGTAGNARVVASKGGSFAISQRASINAIGSGGGIVSSPDGTGGIGTGGEARIGTNIGSPAGTTLALNGDLFLEAGGSGGFGGSATGVGGAGFGGTPADPVNGPFDKGAFLAATGGAVTITGVSRLDASGLGGDGGGQGGAGTGGWAEIFFSGATLDAAGIVSMDSSGLGGDAFGTVGGVGGLGTGGLTGVTASSGGRFGMPLTATSRITIDTVAMDVSGQGGSGGEGAPGAGGGRGGDGIGGQGNAVAQAGGGRLEIATTTMLVVGAGGDGGAGGAEGAAGTGGAGGRGGDGIGGFINFGTASGVDTPINQGSADLQTATLFVIGAGGQGGAGGSGSKGDGAGGAGGDAFGGSGALLARGTPVTTSSVVINADAFGGQGGDGATTGAGGSATGGAARLLATNRANRTERGSVTATSLSFTSTALGGLGGAGLGESTAGQAFAQVTKADVTTDDLLLGATGNLPPPAGQESGILVDDGTLRVGNLLDLFATGDVLVGVVNNGLLSAEIFNISATGSLLPPAAGTPGLIEIGTSFTGSFGGDFITVADFDLAGSIALQAGGDIQVGDVKAGGDVHLIADGSITTGTIAAGDSIDLEALGAVTTGDLTAALGDPEIIFGDIAVDAGGAIKLGDVRAVGIEVNEEIDLAAAPAADVTIGAVVAEGIEAYASGTLTIGNVSIDNLYPVLEPDGGATAALAANGRLQTGAITSNSAIALGSYKDSIVAGPLQADAAILLLARDNISIGGATTKGGAGNLVFAGNISILDTEPAFSGFDFEDFGPAGDFDPASLKAIAPVRLDGDFASTGPIATGGFAAGAFGFQSGDVTAPDRLLIDAGGPIAAGALTTDEALTLKTSQVVTLTGLASARTISIESGDLVLFGQGRIGTAATDTLTLKSTSSLTFGGGGVDGYSISGDEAQGLRASAITVAGDGIVVRDVTLNGSGAGSAANLVGEQSDLLLESSGGLRVEGAFTINNAEQGNLVTLSAAGALDVVTDQGGSIAVLGASTSTLGGILRIQGEAIRVATAALIGQLPGQTAEQRFAALRTPPAGSPRPEGWVQARRIDFAGNQVFIQNSNTEAQFGGFSAGSGGANLRPRSQSIVDAIIFGRIADPAGAFKINQEAVALLTLNNGEGQSSLTETSSFNACAFSGPCAAPEPPPPEEEEEVEQVVEIITPNIEALVNGAMSSIVDPEAVATLPSATIITAIDAGPLRTDPVISDPVTGGGNPSLWDSPEDRSEREDDRPAPGGDGQ